MKFVEQAEATAGKGLEGDRYGEGRGAYSAGKRVTIRHLSLIAAEAIRDANQGLTERFYPEDTRRNIMTLGIDLNQLVGRKFLIGGISVSGVELCDPCDRPSILSKKPHFNERFQNRGGLRVEVLSSGLISVGDHIIVDQSEVLTKLHDFLGQRVTLVLRDGTRAKGRLHHLGTVLEDSDSYRVILDGSVSQVFDTLQIVDVEHQ